MSIETGVNITVEGLNRERVHDQVVLARQKLRSAAVLWSNGQSADGLRLVRECVDETLRALELAASVRVVPSALGRQAAPPAKGPGWEAFLADAGARPADITRVRAAEARALSGPLPAFNRQVEPAHQVAFRSMMLGAETALVLMARVIARPRPRLRRAIAIGACVAALLFVGGLLVARGRPAARASAKYGYDDKFAPRRVLDGDPLTEWLLPTQETGWLEVSLGGRPIKALKLLNGRNTPHYDRAIFDLRIECYVGERQVHSSKHRFGVLGPNPDWLRVALDLPRVDRILVIVDSFQKVGAGLAEVAWES